LVAYANIQFILNAKQEDKCTLRDHLIVAWKSNGIKPEQLEYDELHENIRYIWGWFCELNGYRTSNGFGANPLDPSLIKDWCWLNKITLEQFEIAALRAIDNEYMVFSSKEK